MAARALGAPRVAREIFAATLRALDPESLVRDAVDWQGETLRLGDEKVPTGGVDAVLVVAIGKAAYPMAKALHAEMSTHSLACETLCVTVADVAPDDAAFDCMVGEHPLPGPGSLRAGAEVLRRVRRHDRPGALILFAISGGASALCEHLAPGGVSDEDLYETHRFLVGCGEPIATINAVRTRLSALKGGGLARAAPLAQQVTVALSDVNPGDLRSLGSGPTILPAPRDLGRGAATIPDAILRGVPAAVADLLRLPVGGSAPRPRPPSSTVAVLGDNRRAIAAAAELAAARLGVPVETSWRPQEPSVEEAACSLSQWCRRRSREALEGGHVPRRSAFVSGGEVRCAVRGAGIGGRSAETALRTAFGLDAQADLRGRDLAVLCCGTDGMDGNSPAAGGVVTPTTLARARTLGLDPAAMLIASDAYTLLQATGDAVVTGPTGNNLRDLRIVVDLGPATGDEA